MNVYQNVFDERRRSSAYWHNRSSDLLISARTLSKAMAESNGLELSCWAPYKMLIGMSFELLFKCHCVENGIAFRPTHDLVQLARTANLPISAHEIDILKTLSAFIVWDGRYPIAKTVNLLEEHWKHQSKSSQGDELDFDKLLPIWRRFSDLYLEVCATSSPHVRGAA